MTGPRVAIVDDHALVRGGLAASVRAEFQAQIVYEGTDPAAVLNLDPPPDLLLLDLDLGGTTADPEMAGAIQRRGTKVLVVSAMASARTIGEMIDVGVSGFVSKRETQEVLNDAIRHVLQDGQWTSPEVATIVMHSPISPNLTPPQQQVLLLYASGMTLKSVANLLGMTVGTASTHLKRARAKYAQIGRPAGTRVELYREAVRDGLIE